MAAGVQGSINFDAVEQGILDELDQDTIDTLFADKAEPFAEASFESVVPLVLVDVDYDPYSQRPVPNGNIAWMRVTDELEMLLSLCAFGIARYAVLAEES